MLATRNLTTHAVLTVSRRSIAYTSGSNISAIQHPIPTSVKRCQQQCGAPIIASQMSSIIHARHLTSHTNSVKLSAVPSSSAQSLTAAPTEAAVSASVSWCGGIRHMARSMFERDIQNPIPVIPILQRMIAPKMRNRVAIGHLPTSCNGTSSETKTYTYSEVLIRASNIADAIKWHMGRDDWEYSRGTPIAFLHSGSIDYVATMLGIWMSGGVAVPLHASHSKPELEYILENSKSELLFNSSEHSEIAEKLSRPQTCREQITWREDEDSGEIVDKLFGSNSNKLPSPSQEQIDYELDQPAMLIYTSGTTSKPKGVVHTHRMLTTQMSILTNEWAWTKDDHILHVLPLHHVHGVVNVLLCALYAGAKCTFLTGKFTTDDIGRAILSKDLNLSLMMAVPTIYSRLLTFISTLSPTDAESFRTSCQRMRLMVSGSAALPQTILDAWESKTGHLLLERYGMSETGMSLSQTLDLEERKKQRGTVGKPLPTVETKIVPMEDTSGAAIPADTAASSASTSTLGELRLKGPSVFLEYWQLPEKTASEFDEQGWFKTGDIVEKNNETGYYRILGRASVDVLKSAGYKISALDVERELLSHPDITEVAVVGVPSEEYGQIVGAVVALRPGSECSSSESLMKWSRTRLASYQVPRLWRIVKTIPRNAMGKTNKKELVKMFDDGARTF